jgi:serine/threonine-protein kinase
MTATRRLSTILIVATVRALLPSNARAQDRAGAEALFDDARRLAEEGNAAAACAKFEESQRLDPAVGTLLNLATCYENAGRNASAWAALREAAARAALAGEERRADAIRAKAQSLEAGLARLQVAPSREGATVGLEIRRDDVTITRSLWGTALPVDPGRHAIGASAPGSLAWSQSIEVPSGPALIVVFVPRLEPVAIRPASSASEIPPAAPPGRSGLTTGRTVGLLIGAVGLGGLLSAAIAGTGAIVLKDDGRRQDARGWAEAFDWIAVSSAVATAAGAAVFFASPVQTHNRRTVAIVPLLGSRGASVVASQAF